MNYCTTCQKGSDLQVYNDESQKHSNKETKETPKWINKRDKLIHFTTLTILTNSKVLTLQTWLFLFMDPKNGRSFMSFH